jgi:hypothetical protein
MRDLCKDCNLLAIGTSFKEELKGILLVVGSDECKIILADSIGGRLTVLHHQLIKDFVGQHRGVPTNGVECSGRSYLVSI